MESKTRPQKASTSKSFSRYEPRTKTPTRSRASTLSNEIRVPAKAIAEETIYPSENENVTEDVFEKRSSEDDVPTAKSMVSSTMTDTLPDGFDELPIELISLTDR